ncbi:hypothetical protein QDW23_gp30 [Microbacterium phage Stromboli]|uniref:hypothetical protein n=1 Tax=Microbacterium phage Stromboli TaxID=2713263 RepID=UPI0014173948|nr:hypothetical protein QDW23_gp30 [Microbacterium phage Stromboli]QIN93689.1 hypothetical protein SEA_STROMBOLI_30 [Microbacterium phage Stromboli]QTF81964.1 hypothetical protein SEA_BABYYODA_30 [Microbacterium phage BabyYoda]
MEEHVFAVVRVYVDPEDGLPTVNYAEITNNEALPVEKRAVARMLRTLADNLERSVQAQVDA